MVSSISLTKSEVKFTCRLQKIQQKNLDLGTVTDKTKKHKASKSKHMPYIIQWQAHLIKENVLIVYMHDAILQSAFPSALGTRHLQPKTFNVIVYCQNEEK